MAWRDLKVGDLHFAVRTDSWEFTAWLDHALGAYITDEEAEVKYSFVVGDAGGRGSVSKTFSIFYWGTVPVVKTLHFPTAIHAFLTELEVMQMSPRRDGLFLRAVPVTDGDAVGLVPVSMIMGMGDETRTAARAGLSFGAPMALRLDPSTGLVSPVPASLALPRDAHDLLSTVTQSGGLDRLVLAPEVKIDAVFAMSTGPIDADANLMEPASRASTLYRIAPWILNLDSFGSSSLEVLGGMVQGARGYTLTPISDRTRLFEALLAGLKEAR
ncbi:MAG: hypothetical protein ACRDKT_17040 [Actinomycetota bacterium]